MPKQKERWDLQSWEEALGLGRVNQTVREQMPVFSDGEAARFCYFNHSCSSVASVVLARTMFQPVLADRWFKSVLWATAMHSIDNWPNQPTGEYAMGAVLGAFESVAWLRRNGLPGTWEHGQQNYLANALDQLAQHLIWLLDNSQRPDYWVTRATNDLLPDPRWEGRLANAVAACWCGLSASTLTFIFQSMFAGESAEEKADFSLREAKLAGIIADRLTNLAIWQTNDPAIRMRAAWHALFLEQ